ncbi:MAG: DUF1638 domain-containing protein [Kiritimatiellaeota bacterium]|nr:DUF1638 domain-containing protein [Kiritimatiellota bacterium]
MAYKFIGCEIIYREACYLTATASRRVDVEFLHKGLHDLSREDMVAKIQEAVDAVPGGRGYEAILLGYARCNDGLVGVTARDIPLVIPKAHDCITFFFGSRQGNREYFDATPGTYYMTSGWAERNGSDFASADDGAECYRHPAANRYGRDGYSRPAYGQEGVMAKLGLTETYESMVEKYGKENADYIIESLGGWAKCYEKCLYLEMGVCNERPFQEVAEEWAKKNDWAYESRKGSMSLLQRLFAGEWDDDFLIVPPGKSIVARQDETILGCEQMA